MIKRKNKQNKTKLAEYSRTMRSFITSTFLSVIVACIFMTTTGCASRPKDWNKCTKASCWNGSNAQQRMMNMLSPHMPDHVFKSYASWQKNDRGCNTVHLILANKSDGEYGGYTIYGPDWTWQINNDYVKKMKSRIEYLQKEGFGIVLWLITDDSSIYARTLSQNPKQYIKDLQKLGFFDYTDLIVLGLEMDEYFSVGTVGALRGELSNSGFKGKIGVHHRSGKYTFAHYGDVIFMQMDPTKDYNKIRNEIIKIKNQYNKPVNFFEFQRYPDREGSQHALDAGAYGVGNW